MKIISPYTKWHGKYYQPISNVTMRVAVIFTVVCLVTLLNSGCSAIMDVLISERLPDQTELMRPIIISRPDIKNDCFEWPNTKEGQEVLQSWWDNGGQEMGTATCLFFCSAIPGCPRFNVFIAKRVFISFSIPIGEYPEKIFYRVSTKKERGRKMNAYDRRLYDYIVKVVKTQPALSDSIGSEKLHEFYK